jgi:hypothetical protein
LSRFPSSFSCLHFLGILQGRAYLSRLPSWFPSLPSLILIGVEGTCFSFVALLGRPEEDPGAFTRVRGRKGGWRADSEVPEEDATPPRADPREQTLPWDMRILRQAEAVRPGAGGRAGEDACAKSAVGSSRPGGPRTSSAGSPTASGSSSGGGGQNVGGKRPSGNASTGRSPRHARSTPQRNVNGVRRRGSPGAGRQPGVRFPGRARGHAERRCRKFSATGRGAMSHHVPALTPAIAGRRAPLPCVRPRTVSASVCGATACRADSSVRGSTKRPASHAA